MNLDSTLAVTKTCPKDGVPLLSRRAGRTWTKFLRAGSRWYPHPGDISDCLRDHHGHYVAGAVACLACGGHSGLFLDDRYYPNNRFK